ncbi:sensor histidine kinase [Pseudomonas sp. NA-150]|uniref:sensor histidine kinase n=1 Tax=Pseudomonas sp. NA-150 TaxID=3367525 RepID=UPI0037C6DAF3
MNLRLPYTNSLFARLLLAQVGLVVALLLVVGLLFYVQRNITLAVLYADQWAPQLAVAAGVKSAPTAQVQVQQRADPPAGAYHPLNYAPRFDALRNELTRRGIPVDDVLLSLDGPEPVVWLHVSAPGQTPTWLGVAGSLVEPQWSGRLVLALLLAGGLLVGMSWVFTRRLTRPLELLRNRIQTHTPGESVPVSAQPLSSISPEVIAIDAAYSELLARLERHERERATLLAGVSHDLRSPLGRIRMAAELLPDEEGVATRKATIVRNVFAADRLIESFLDYVRSSELSFSETVDLAAVGRAVVAGFERPPSELDLSVPDSLLWPKANRLLVERTLLNLIDNALKHGRPPVQLSMGRDDARVWIVVEDAGQGIDPDRVEQLQEAFSRGDNSRATAGSGLGLAIVRQVVARLGGELSFERGESRQRVRITLRVKDLEQR